MTQIPSQRRARKAAKHEAEPVASPEGGDLQLIQPPNGQTAVKRTIVALRLDALAAEPGAMIGSEEDLVARYDVSRPTLRQADGIVAQEQLVRVRRGVGGGYFADRPTFMAVAQMAAVFLQSQRTSFSEILHAIEPVRLALVEMATSNKDPEIIQEWRNLIEEIEHYDKDTNLHKSYLRIERHFGNVLGKASRNNVLSLFLQTLLELVARSITRAEDVFIDHPERIAEQVSRRFRIVQAIIDGDSELALLEAKRSTRAAAEWLMNDLKQAQGSDDTSVSVIRRGQVPA